MTRRILALRPVFDEKIRYVTSTPGDTASVVLPDPPTTLSIVGSTSDPLLDGAWRIAVSGNYAYVTTVTKGLTVVDVSSPAAPSVVANIPRSSFGNSSLRGVAALGASHVVVTSDQVNSLYVVDVSTPTSPSIVGNTTIIAGNFPGGGVAVSGQYAYTVTWGTADRFTAIDVSNPASPSVVGSITHATNLNEAYDVAMYGSNYVVVTQFDAILGGGRVAVVDVSNPTSPTIAGTRVDAALEYSQNVAVFNHFAIITSQNTGQSVIFDVLNPSLPVARGKIGAYGGPAQNAGVVTYLHPTGYYALTADFGADTVRLHNVNNTTTPTTITSVTDATLLQQVQALAGSGPHFFATAPYYPTGTFVSLLVS